MGLIEAPFITHSSGINFLRDHCDLDEMGASATVELWKGWRIALPSFHGQGKWCDESHPTDFFADFRCVDFR